MKSNFLVLIVFSFVSTAVFAKTPIAPFIDGVRARPLTVHAENVNIEGYRFLNADGEPNHGKAILFTHGLHSSLHEFEYLIKEKMALGYDCYAFNFRGHGNGDEKSRVIQYHEGDYRFDNIAEIDFPSILKTVHEMSGHKVIVIGHSMGGMVPRASIALGTIDQRDIESMVLIGSPPHFRTKMTIFPPHVVEFIKQQVYAGSGQDRLSTLDLLHEFEANMDFVNLMNPFYWVVKFGLDMSWGTAWSRRAHSDSIPKDIVRSFIAFQDHYPYEDVKIDVPTLYVIGQRDVLVRADEIMEAAKIQSRDGGYWFVTLKGVGHLSLVSPSALNLYKKDLQDFLDRPANIGPANETHHQHTPGICQRFLLGA